MRGAECSSHRKWTRRSHLFTDEAMSTPSAGYRPGRPSPASRPCTQGIPAALLRTRSRPGHASAYGSSSHGRRCVHTSECVERAPRLNVHGNTRSIVDTPASPAELARQLLVVLWTTNPLLLSTVAGKFAPMQRRSTQAPWSARS